MSAAGDKPQPNDSLGLVPFIPKDLLLAVFIHGFKGTDSTFGDFPSRLGHILTETMNNVAVECISFPAYETKGELNAAVERFVDWLATLTVQKEVAAGGGAGVVKIVLCGHSMGGLLAADALRSLIKSRADQNTPLWPRIIACIAFDTPYLGLHPFVFKHSATRVAEVADAARTIVSDVSYFLRKSENPSTSPPDPPLLRLPASVESGSAEAKSGWARWTSAAYAIGGAVAAGAAAGAAYWKREDISSGYNWAFEHMKYVGNLWDDSGMHERLDNLMLAETAHGVVFKTFYVLLPPSLPAFPSQRTFVILPPRASPAWERYIVARNSLASDEIQAHTNMFDPAQNDGYYELGLEVAKIIREAAVRSGMRSTVPTGTEP